MDNQIIALAAHPANKDASAHHVCDVRIGRSIGAVFKASNGFVPAFKGMASAGYLPDAAAAVNWIHDNHQQIN